MKNMAISKRRYACKKSFYSYSDFLAQMDNILEGICHRLNADYQYLLSKSREIVQSPVFFSDNYDHLMGLFPFCISGLDNLPVFCLQDDLCKAFNNSFVPSNATLNNLWMPYGLVVFPIHNKVDIKYAVFLDSSEFIFVLLLGKKQSRFGVLGIDKSKNLSLCICDDESEDRKKENLIKQIFLYKSAYPSAELTYEQQARHGLIVPDKKRGVMGYNPKKLSPIIIGENYRIKRERVESTGTHASPQTHWRSGHWRQQPIGKRDNPEYKTIWIEPVLVNG